MNRGLILAASVALGLVSTACKPRQNASALKAGEGAAGAGAADLAVCQKEFNIKELAKTDRALARRITEFLLEQAVNMNLDSETRSRIQAVKAWQERLLASNGNDQTFMEFETEIGALDANGNVNSAVEAEFVAQEMTRNIVEKARLFAKTAGEGYTGAEAAKDLKADVIEAMTRTIENVTTREGRLQQLSYFEGLMNANETVRSAFAANGEIGKAYGEGGFTIGDVIVEALDLSYREAAQRWVADKGSASSEKALSAVEGQIRTTFGIARETGAGGSYASEEEKARLKEQSPKAKSKVEERLKASRTSLERLRKGEVSAAEMQKITKELSERRVIEEWSVGERERSSREAYRPKF